MRKKLQGETASQYPSRAVTFVVPFAPGGVTSVFARLVGQRLEQKLEKPFIAENHPGGVVAATAFARTVAEANPGKLNYYSVGIGSTSHLSTMFFMDVTGTRMQHVRYSQMSQGINDLLSGRTEISFGPMGRSIGNIRAGKMRALALSGPARSKLLPDVPTLTEVGVNMPEESSWYGFFAHKGTPKAVIAKVNADLEKVLAMPDLREREIQLGYRFIGGPPDKLASFVSAEIAKWRALDRKGAFK